MTNYQGKHFLLSEKTVLPKNHGPALIFVVEGRIVKNNAPELEAPGQVQTLHVPLELESSDRVNLQNLTSNLIRYDLVPGIMTYAEGTVLKKPRTTTIPPAFAKPFLSSILFDVSAKVINSISPLFLTYSTLTVTLMHRAPQSRNDIQPIIPAPVAKPKTPEKALFALYKSWIETRSALVVINQETANIITQYLDHRALKPADALVCLPSRQDIQFITQAFRKELQ